MPFIAVNTSNLYDAANLTRYATKPEADTRAREILAQFPTAQVFTAQVIQEYSAQVSITVKEPDEVEPAPADPV